MKSSTGVPIKLTGKCTAKLKAVKNVFDYGVTKQNKKRNSG